MHHSSVIGVPQMHHVHVHLTGALTFNSVKVRSS